MHRRTPNAPPRWAKILLRLLLVLAGLLAAAIVFGGPSQPRPIGSITDPFA